MGEKKTKGGKQEKEGKRGKGLNDEEREGKRERGKGEKGKRVQNMDYLHNQTIV